MVSLLGGSENLFRTTSKMNRSMSLLFGDKEPWVGRRSSPPLSDNVSAQLRTQRIRIDFFDKKPVDLDAVVQDSLPGGSSIGTVVGCPGSPGSHEDFKYILPHLHNYGIRFIGINFPGQGISPHNEQLCYSNDERMQFVQKIINSLNIGNELVFMGHSRGSENALRMAAINPDRSAGVVLVNPMGVKVHRGIKPTWIISFAVWLWESLRKFRFIIRHIFYASYRILKIKVRNGDEAAVCLKTMGTVDLEGQVKYVKMLNNSDTKVLIAYSTLDRFIEEAVSQHFASLFHNIIHVNCPFSTETDIPVLEDVQKRYSGAERSFAVCFEKEGHFLQKYRAKFIADCIYSILSGKNETRKNDGNVIKSVL